MNAKLLGLPVLTWIPLLPLLGAAFNLLLGRKLSRGVVHAVAIASVVASFGVSVWQVAGPLWSAFQAFKAGEAAAGQGLLHHVYTWIEVGAFKVDLAFRLDTLSAVMILVVTGVGSLIHIYSTGYMAHDPRYAAFFGYLNLFTGAMLVLVLGANLPVMFIGWEGVGVCSYLLIGFWFEKEAYAYAGRKAFVVNRIGDFAFLLGMFLLYWATKDLGFSSSLDFADLRTAASEQVYVQQFWGGERLAAAAGILLFIGACGKSAQIPLYVWLPDAMAGPTPVSALIHAATMVTAGVYMVVRLSFLFAASTTAMIVVATVGTLTALVAAYMAFAQTDLKKVLAYSTVSQLGFMFVAAGTGNWVAAIFHLGTHAFFKAGLFLGAGSVMHGMNDVGDIRQMGGLREKMPFTHVTFLIYCLAIAGFPLTAGFFSKDEILAGAFAAHHEGWPQYYGVVLWAGLTIAALGTAFYMWRLYFLVFWGKPRTENAEHAHESPANMWGPLVVLAVLSLLAGWIQVPHLSGFPGLHFLGDWLSPVIKADTLGHLSQGTTWILLITATGIGLLGIAIAYALYGKGVPAEQVGKLTRGPLATAYKLSKNKLFVDEIYDVIIVRPFTWVARGCFELVDRFIIDTVLVNGSAYAVSMMSRIARWVQNGQVQRYIVGLVIGGAVIFLIASRAHQPTFSYRAVPGGVELRAEPGEGIAQSGAHYRWDVDGDGAPDRKLGAAPDAAGDDAFVSDQVIVVREGDLGSTVTVWIESPLLGKTVTVTRDIELGDLGPAAAPAATGQAPTGQPTMETR
jgi:NADH-quinone oxidoreductase subunit L